MNTLGGKGPPLLYTTDQIKHVYSVHNYIHIT